MHRRHASRAVRRRSGPAPGPGCKTYGTLGGVIAFLVWLWVSNIAVLLGAEFNAELERGRQLEAGVPPHDKIRVQPRATPKER